MTTPRLRTVVPFLMIWALAAVAGSTPPPEPCGAPDPSPAPATFEDIYGPSGESFQGALGFRVFEGSSATGAALTSFGVAVDDMVVQWREFALIDDGTDCSTSGACATVAVDTSLFYESDGSLRITVTDASPYGQGEPVNDCNRDGDFGDAGIDDQDCDDDGIQDVLLRATSLVEGGYEWVVLNRAGASDAYLGNLPVSPLANVPGVLYFSDGGLLNPDVTLLYDDRWDGSSAGIPCRASADPSQWGIVELGVQVALLSGKVSIPRVHVSDGPGTGAPPLPAGQDGDGYPDTGETVDLYLTVRNQTGLALTNLVAQMVTSDPKIDCVTVSSVVIGSVGVGATVEAAAPFRFVVAAAADRSGVVPPVACSNGACSNGAGACSTEDDCKESLLDDYSASFTITFASDQFDVAASPQSVVVDLDLNVTAPVKTTSTFADGFESGVLNFTLQSLDDGLASNALSDGKRCQYNDPDFVNSNSYGDTECYLGFRIGQPTPNDWHLHDTLAVDGGRAYLGSRSMHYGVHVPGSPGLDTYGLSQMDTIRTKSPLNLASRICRDDPASEKRSCGGAADCAGVGGGPCIAASPELSFKHQISTVDSRHTSSRDGAAPDRAILQAQVSQSIVWQKIYPYDNVYDVQGTDQFSNCLFDPDDDGNDEDSYFDPSDPNRRLGPSSTCYPEFVFSYLGDTDAPFSPANIGRASDGPGLEGSLGIGTWVESKFDLSRFRGRSVRIRWLITTIKVSDSPTHEALFMWNPIPADDGWYVDDVRVSQTLGASVPTASYDTTDNSALPGCGAPCTALAAGLSASPPSAPSPGRRVELSALGSSADRCLDGTLLYQFWIDGDGNGTLGDAEDTIAREFAVDPIFEDAPSLTTRYGVRVKCSSSPAPCTDDETVLVTVGCPGAPGTYLSEAWWTNLRFDDETTLVTPLAHQRIDAVRGVLNALRAGGAFGGETCLASDLSGRTITDAATPASGDGFYYLLRGADAACNENRSWRTFSAAENPGDPARRDTQISACSP